LSARLGWLLSSSVRGYQDGRVRLRGAGWAGVSRLRALLQARHEPPTGSL